MNEFFTLNDLSLLISNLILFLSYLPLMLLGCILHKLLKLVSLRKILYLSLTLASLSNRGHLWRLSLYFLMMYGSNSLLLLMEATALAKQTERLIKIFSNFAYLLCVLLLDLL
jgi:hypothetical protein